MLIASFTVSPWGLRVLDSSSAYVSRQRSDTLSPSCPARHGGAISEVNTVMYNQTVVVNSVDLEILIYHVLVTLLLQLYLRILPGFE